MGTTVTLKTYQTNVKKALDNIKSSALVKKILGTEALPEKLGPGYITSIEKEIEEKIKDEASGVTEEGIREFLKNISEFSGYDSNAGGDLYYKIYNHLQLFKKFIWKAKGVRSLNSAVRKAINGLIPSWLLVNGGAAISADLKKLKDRPLNGFLDSDDEATVWGNDETLASSKNVFFFEKDTDNGSVHTELAEKPKSSILTGSSQSRGFTMEKSFNAANGISGAVLYEADTWGDLVWLGTVVCEGLESSYDEKRFFKEIGKHIPSILPSMKVNTKTKEWWCAPALKTAKCNFRLHVNITSK